jgi:two-component system CheB/CheR fusion protein
MPAKTAKAERDLETLLEYLKGNRGFDFLGYKRASLARRIVKRMHELGVSDYGDYVDFLEVHPEEFAILFNTILINVTSFFRDEASWDFLNEKVLPDLISRKGATAPIRIWSAGCASGEEAYTLAMVFAELLGPEAFKERVKIYGTDVDEDALSCARAGTYNERDVENLPMHLLGKYFHRNDSTYVFKKDYRRQVIFGRHDLIQDAPISKVDFLVCRNALMYFNAETQTRILARFHFALNEGGVLFLGRAETMLTHANTFAPIDLKRRISTKVPRGSLDLRDRLMLISQGGGDDAANGNGANHTRLRELAADAAPIAELVVDFAGALITANDRARSMFSLSREDIGRSLQDLKVSYRPVELRSLLDRAYADKRLFIVRDVEWPTQGSDPRWLEVQVVPMMDVGTKMLGAAITFIDTTAAKRLQEQLERTNQELEAAYEELQSTNEELETTNEELQSTIEELETTNEELQSTNEELETMNEELQSTNEELTTMNDELRQRGDELNQVNGFFDSVLTSLRGAVVMVDPQIQILVWNKKAEDLWGLREDEVAGKQLVSLDIGLPVEKLKQPLKACIGGTKDSVELALDATNRRGRPFRCRVLCMPLASNGERPRGAIVVMEDVDGGEPAAGLRRGNGKAADA